jgi:hypothetical protein
VIKLKNTLQKSSVYPTFGVLLRANTIKRKEVITMDETIKNESVVNETTVEEDPLKEAINEQLKKIQRQNLLLGAQTICHTVLEKILKAENQPGKRTMNDYRRLIKDLKKFCETGLSRKVNTDGETEPIEKESTTEKTVQN